MPIMQSLTELPTNTLTYGTANKAAPDAGFSLTCWCTWASTISRLLLQRMRLKCTTECSCPSACWHYAKPRNFERRPSTPLELECIQTTVRNESCEVEALPGTEEATAKRQMVLGWTRQMFALDKRAADDASIKAIQGGLPCLQVAAREAKKIWSDATRHGKAAAGYARDGRRYSKKAFTNLVPPLNYHCQCGEKFESRRHWLTCSWVKEELAERLAD